MYSLTTEVVKGVNIVTALQNYPNMPGIQDIFNELDYLNECIKDSERYYGVAFKRATGKQAESIPSDQFDVISDTKDHLEEFYFGSPQEITFGFRPRAMYRLVIEPLLDSMEKLSHDEVLDYSANVIEQIKEYATMAEAQNRLDAATAYKLYRETATQHQKEKKIKEQTAGVMKLRRKTLALQKELARSRGQ